MGPKELKVTQVIDIELCMAASANFMVPELRREREASKLDLPELTIFIDGGEVITKTRKKICMA